MAGNALMSRAAYKPGAPEEEDEDARQEFMLDMRRRTQGAPPHKPGDWPQSPSRGIDGRMYGPGYAADPTGGTDSSPVQKMYGNDWLDNVVKLSENGLLHPKVLELLGPAIEALEKSQKARGKYSDPATPY